MAKSVKNLGGRPLKFGTPQELEARCEEYFKVREKEKKPLTISSLAVFLDTSRETLCNYQNKDEFFDVVKKSKDRILAWQEDSAIEGKTNTVFTIFSLKNSYNWSDKVEYEDTTQPRKVFDFFTDRGITKDESEY